MEISLFCKEYKDHLRNSTHRNLTVSEAVCFYWQSVSSFVSQKTIGSNESMVYTGDSLFGKKFISFLSSFRYHYHSMNS